MNFCAKGGQKWEAIEDNKLIDEIKSRTSIDQISEDHKRSIGAIIARLKLLTITDPELLNEEDIAYYKSFTKKVDKVTINKDQHLEKALLKLNLAESKLELTYLNPDDVSDEDVIEYLQQKKTITDKNAVDVGDALNEIKQAKQLLIKVLSGNI